MPRKSRTGTKKAAPKYVPKSKPPKADPRPQITSAELAVAEVEELRTAETEHFVVLDLDAKLRVITKRLIAIGHATGVFVHPREVFRDAIRNGAISIIVLHNHPSGDPEPSQDDMYLTNRLQQVGDLCAIGVIDHVVVAADGYVSITERRIAGGKRCKKIYAFASDNYGSTR